MEGEMCNSWNFAMLVWNKLDREKREAEEEGGRNLKGIPPLLEFW